MTYLALGSIELESGERENALPCPFCAAVADLTMPVLFLGPEGNQQAWYFIVCLTCHAAGPHAADGRAAVVAWNSRFFYQDSDDAPATLPD